MPPTSTITGGVIMAYSYQHNVAHSRDHDFVLEAAHHLRTLCQRAVASGWKGEVDEDGRHWITGVGWTATAEREPHMELVGPWAETLLPYLLAVQSGHMLKMVVLLEELANDLNGDAPSKRLRGSVVEMAEAILGRPCPPAIDRRPR